MPCNTLTKGNTSTPKMYKKKCKRLIFSLCNKAPYDLKNRSKNIKPTSKKEAITAEYAISGFAKEITINNGISIIPIILLIKKIIKA